jgi:F-type H+-transporting ATPase subunit a
MSLGTLVLVLYYSVKVKGLGGWLHELAVAPFGMAKITWNPLTWIAALLLGVANVGMNLVEYCGRTLSHGMRLYGNMYAGELIFFLIAGLGGTVTVYGIAMHLISGWSGRCSTS